MPFPVGAVRTYIPALALALAARVYARSCSSLQSCCRLISPMLVLIVCVLALAIALATDRAPAPAPTPTLALALALALAIALALALARTFQSSIRHTKTG